MTMFLFILAVLGVLVFVEQQYALMRRQKVEIRDDQERRRGSASTRR